MITQPRALRLYGERHAQDHPRAQRSQDQSLGFRPFSSTRHFPLSDSARGSQHLQNRWLSGGKQGQPLQKRVLERNECRYCLFHSSQRCRVAASFQGQLLGAHPEEGSGGGRGGTAVGKRRPVSCSREPPLLSPLRYQEVQAAQKALGTAVAEALPEAERALAAMQRVDADAALRLASLAAPAALVSPAGQPRSAAWGGGGGRRQRGDQCGPAQADDVAYF